MSASILNLKFTLYALLEASAVSKCQIALQLPITSKIRPLQRLTYAGEYDFQTDITALTTRARDGHFSFSGDATQLFFFKRKTAVVSISSDGSALPQIYVLGE